MRTVVIAMAAALAATPALAQAPAPQTGQSSPGAANPGPSQSDMRRSNPVGTSDASGNVSGSHGTQNSGNAPVPVQQGASQGNQRGGEVTRSDSAR